MQSMADWYLKADKLGDQVEQQTRLSRILDVAQDLKVGYDQTNVFQIIFMGNIILRIKSEDILF